MSQPSLADNDRVWLVMQSGKYSFFVFVDSQVFEGALG